MWDPNNIFHAPGDRARPLLAPADTFTKTPAPQQTELVGGNLIAGFGGYLAVGVFRINEERIDVIEDAIDVAGWVLHEEKVARRHALSGSWGALSRRIVAADWTAVATIWYNQDRPAVLQTIRKAKRNSNLGLALQIGDRGAYDMSNKRTYHRFVSPMCVITAWGTECNTGSIVRQTVNIAGNSLIFHLYDETDINTYLEYLEHIKHTMPSD